MDAKYYKTLHLLHTGYAKVTKRKEGCFYVVFENNLKHEFCIPYSDTLKEDEIFLTNNLKDLRLKEDAE